MRSILPSNGKAIVPVDEIVPGIRKDGLATLEEIREGNYPKPKIGIGHAYSSALHLLKSFENVHYKELVDALSKRVNGTGIIDLGAGVTNSGYRIAEILGAEYYVGIEGHFASRLLYQLEQSPPGTPFIPACVIGEDMLSALKRFPESCSSILACNIDCTIIRYKEYRRSIEDEIRRVLQPEGVYISYLSDLQPLGVTSIMSGYQHLISRYQDLIVYKIKR